MDEVTQKMTDLAARCDKQRKRFYARQPRAISQVLGTLVLKNHYACVETGEQIARVWADVVSPATALRTQPLGVKRGKFEVIVAHSALAQELSFERTRILKALRAALPETKIHDVKFRVGKIDDQT